MVSYWDMLPGASLEAEISNTCKGRQKEINLEIAHEVKKFNEIYGENLSFGEFVEAYHPRSSPQPKEESE